MNREATSIHPRPDRHRRCAMSTSQYNEIPSPVSIGTLYMKNTQYLIGPSNFPTADGLGSIMYSIKASADRTRMMPDAKRQAIELALGARSWRWRSGPIAPSAVIAYVNGMRTRVHAWNNSHFSQYP